VDSIIFVPLAFYFLPTIHALFDAEIAIYSLDLVGKFIVGQIVVKWFLGVIDTPFMYLTRWIYEKN